MKHIKSINAFVLTLTSGAAFYVWLSLNNLILNNEAIKGFVSSHVIILVMISMVFTVGFYHLLLYLIIFVFNKLSFIRKIILGEYFLEGYWVGFCMTSMDSYSLFYEVIEQYVDKIIIRGTFFNNKNEYLGYWVSDNVNFDVEKGIITYYYEVDSYRNTFINSGLASFRVKRHGIDKPPHEMVGYSSNLFNNKKLFSLERKIENTTILTTSSLLDRAKLLYEEYMAETKSNINS